MNLATEAGRIGFLPTFSFEGWYLPEPQLIFGDGKTFIDPKVGLQLYGPLKAEEAKTTAPTSIKVGIIGTGETVSQANRWLDRINDSVVPTEVDSIQSPSFPGFRRIFSCDLVKSNEFNDLISEAEVQQIRRLPTFEDRVEKAVNLFVEGLQNVSSGSFRPDIVICALPDDVVNYCVVKRGILGRTKGKLPGELRELIDKLRDYKRVHQTFLDSGFQEEADRIINATFPETTNFWRNLKAEAMRIPMPTQIMWPDTLARQGLTRQDDASVAWNTSVGLYYKGSGFPWTMTRMQVGTCYVGISFFRNPADQEGRLRTSLAQIFTYTGEGLVLRGESFDWDTTLDNTPHMTEAGARELLVAALSLYNKRLHSQPGRVVLHKSSTYWPDERRGFLDALRGIPRHDFVSFGDKYIKFFRFGKYPPLRGTVIKIDKGSYVLYTRGYIPYTQTYPGARVPWPLDITHEGDSTADTILSEILALTKMNWNSAEFSISQPITMVFSDRVGDVMSSIPTNIEPLHEYRYYM